MPEQFVWTPADGSPPIDLTDEDAGYSVEAEGTRGLRSVSYSFATATFAGVDGEDVQAVRAEANHPSLGMLLRASSEAELRRRARGLVHAMRPKAGPGTLTVTTEDGESRRLSCYVEDGLAGDLAEDSEMPGRWWRFILKLYAPRPWWRGAAQTLDFGLAAPSVFLSSTMPFPRMLAASTIQGQRNVDLTAADATSYPLWTVTGPGSGLTLSNRTRDPLTGKQVVSTIQVNASVGDGQTIVIDTRRGQQSVRRGDGINLMGALASDPSLWPLVDGQVNEVTAVLGAAGAAARIRAVYEPRYAGI